MRHEIRHQIRHTGPLTMAESERQAVEFLVAYFGDMEYGFTVDVSERERLTRGGETISQTWNIDVTGWIAGSIGRAPRDPGRPGE